MLKNEVMMTSLMINLDSHADFFNEIPEYSEYMVSFVFKFLLVNKNFKHFKQVEPAQENLELNF